MKKAIVIPVLAIGMNCFSQNILQVSNLNVLSNQAVVSNNIALNNNVIQHRIQAAPALATNVMRRNTSTGTNANSNPVNRQVGVQRQRRTVRRVVNAPVRAVQTAGPLNNEAQVFENNEPEQTLQVAVLNNIDNNDGNSFGNEMIQVQQKAVVIQTQNKAIPQNEKGGSRVTFNLPKIEFGSLNLKRSSHASSTSSHHISKTKSKLQKLNWKLKGKFAFAKKLRVKVDKCFEW